LTLVDTRVDVLTALARASVAEGAIAVGTLSLVDLLAISISVRLALMMGNASTGGLAEVAIGACGAAALILIAVDLPLDGILAGTS
jgi:hypothetical protein